MEQESNISYLNKKLFSNEYHHFALEIYINFINSIDKGKNGLLSSFDEFCNVEIENKDFRNESYNYRNHKIKVSNLGKFIREDKIKLFNFNENNKNINPEDIQIKILDIFKCILINFFNVIIRSKEKKYFSCYVDLIKYLINSYDYCANYFLEEFSCYNVIIEYLINCPLYEIKKVIVELINYAMNKSIRCNKEEEKVGIQDNNEEILKNNPKYNEIFENEKKINNKPKPNRESLNNILKDFEIIESKEVESISKTTLQNPNNAKKKGKKKSDIANTENAGKNKINNIDKNPNDDPEEKISISHNVINLINNIYYTMRQIKFANKNEERFLFYVLLKFSLLFDKTRNYLNKEYRLNLLTYFHISNKQNVDQLRMFDENLLQPIKMEHEILNSDPQRKIYGEKDKVGVYKILSYDFMFLCNLLYYKERAWEELEKKYDRYFSFYYEPDEETDTNDNNISLLLKKAQTKQSINYLANLFKKKCYDDKTFFDNLLARLLEILEYISDNENSFIDKFDEENIDEIYKDSKNDFLLRRLRNNVGIILIKILFDLKDNKLDEYRMKNTINGLCSLFKKYKKYYGISISIINILIDIFSQQNDLLQKYKKSLNDILDWLQKYKIPPKLYDIKGIKMYKPNNHRDEYEMMMYSQYSREIDKKVKEDFDKVETEKTNKKIEFINSILNNETMEKDISNLNCDLSDFKFAIGDEVIYDKKNYVIVECLDELIKIKLIDSNEESEFKAKGYHEKKLTASEKEKRCFWVETNNYKLRIKRLYTPNFKKEVNQIVNSFYQDGNEIKN